MNPPILFTIGHSNHPISSLIARLKKHEITLVADVRSNPWSRYNPWFNRRRLAEALKMQGIAYLFLGRELGGRTADPDCFDDNGRIRYDRVAEKPWFRQGIARLLVEAKRFDIALMCAEKEPLHCHRTLLVSHALAKGGSEIVHILADGSAESHRDTMDRLIRDFHNASSDNRSNRRTTLDLFAAEGESTVPTKGAAYERARLIEEAISMQTRKRGFKRDGRKR